MENKPKEVAIGILKGVIGAIPYAGTAINEILFDISGRIKQQRLESFVK